MFVDLTRNIVCKMQTWHDQLFVYIVYLSIPILLGYNDILNVLERLESETKNEEDESNSKGSEAGDNDSGRPQSEQNGSLSDFSSPKRTTSSTGGGPPPPPTLRPSSSSEARKSSEGFATTTTNKRTNNESVQKGGGGAGGSKVKYVLTAVF